MNHEDDSLLAHYAINEEEAFKVMFDRYYADFCVFARLYVGRQSIAEDLVQQVFIHFWEQKRHKIIKTSLKNYLQQSVRYACLNELKRQKPEDPLQEGSAQDILAEQALDFLLDKEAREIFDQAIGELPVKCRRVFEMVYFDDAQYKAVAENLQVSVNTVKSHLKNALRILKSNKGLKIHFQPKD
jgi:RNA polymerase sigma-70 factor (ECF subfamily)